MDGTRAGDGLEGDDPLVLDRRRILAQDQLLRSLSEVDQATDWKVFVVEIGVITEELVGLSGFGQYGLHTRKPCYTDFLDHG